MLAGYEAQKSHETSRRIEPHEVVELGNDGHGRERVDSAEASKTADDLGVARLLARVLDVIIERLQTRRDMLDGQQIVLEYQLVLRVLEAEAAQPEPVALPPGLPAPHQAPPEEKLAQAMPATHEILLRVFSLPAEIANRLVLRRRWMDFRQ